MVRVTWQAAAEMQSVLDVFVRTGRRVEPSTSSNTTWLDSCFNMLLNKNSIILNNNNNDNNNNDNGHARVIPTPW